MQEKSTLAVFMNLSSRAFGLVLFELQVKLCPARVITLSVLCWLGDIQIMTTFILELSFYRKKKNHFIKIDVSNTYRSLRKEKIVEKYGKS